jgi:hypothetical protein
VPAVQPVDKIPTGMVMTFDLPPQIDPLKENEVENFVNKSEVFAQFVTYSSLILSTMFRISLTLLLGAIHAC